MLVCTCVVRRVMRAVVCYSAAIRSAFGKRQPQELVRHWIRTATRNSLSDDSRCGQLRVS